jgi:hypothetical protein
MSTTEAAARLSAEIIRIVEAVALEPCEAVQHGQEPCPLQFDDQEHWCLPCAASAALDRWMNA